GPTPVGGVAPVGIDAAAGPREGGGRFAGLQFLEPQGGKRAKQRNPTRRPAGPPAAAECLGHGRTPQNDKDDFAVMDPLWAQGSARFVKDNRTTLPNQPILTIESEIPAVSRRA